MKKRISYILSGLLVLLASCTDDMITDHQEGLRITGTVNTGSRTTFVDEGNLTHTHWVANDAIGMYTDTQSNIAYKAVSDGSSTEFIQSGNYYIKAEEGKKVMAYYPYSNNASGNEIPLPNTVSQRSGQPASAFLYSEGTINKNTLSLSFKHLYAYLKITINTKLYKSKCNPDWTLKGGGIYVESSEPISISDATYNIKNKTITHKDNNNIRVFHYADNINPDKDETYTYLIPILPQSGNKPITIGFFYPITNMQGYIGLNPFVNKSTPEEGIQSGTIYVYNPVGMNADGEWPQMEALTAFYESTNGITWSNNKNWLSKEPLEEWFGVNNDSPGLNQVSTLNLAYNNLTGTLDDSFASLMDNAVRLDLSQNYLGGTLPDAVKNHRNWNNLGWLIVPQDIRKGGGFDLTDSKLYANSINITHVQDKKQTALKDIFSQNKLTQVIYYSAQGINDVMSGFDATRVNQHLDYQSKGFGTIIFTGREANANNSGFIADLEEKYGSIADINWAYGGPSYPTYSHMTYVFDTNGQLVYIAPYSTMADNYNIQKAYNEFIQSVLGDPVEHETFSFDFYTSTDYSKDGEVLLLQEATVGNGIDIVLLGEGFVDTDMDTGGKYENKMKEAMEKMFELEPYKTLRNRFNIYTVKVVSPTSEFTSGAPKRINENNETAFDLASKYNPNLTEDSRMMIVVLYNTESASGRSYCTMYSSGDFVAYNMTAIDNTLIHEVCGHGIAKLADEYVEGGYEETSLPVEEQNYLDESWSWDWGWNANVDYHDTASTVRWSRLLNDSRYTKDDIGIYEGAFTYGLGAYRPSENSMMRYNISWFNAPSREAIYKAIMTLSEGEGWTYNYEDFVAYDAKNIGTSAATARSAAMKQSPKERQEIREKHREPVFIKGSLRDAARQSRNRDITVPLK